MMYPDLMNMNEMNLTLVPEPGFIEKKDRTIEPISDRKEHEQTITLTLT